MWDWQETAKGSWWMTFEDGRAKAERTGEFWGDVELYQWTIEVNGEERTGRGNGVETAKSLAEGTIDWLHGQQALRKRTGERPPSPADELPVGDPSKW